jgi:hypothetical protein
MGKWFVTTISQQINKHQSFLSSFLPPLSSTFAGCHQNIGNDNASRRIVPRAQGKKALPSHTTTIATVVASGVWDATVASGVPGLFFFSISQFLQIMIFLDRLCLRSGTITETRDASVNVSWASSVSFLFIFGLIFLSLTIISYSLAYSQCVIIIPPRNSKKGSRMPAQTQMGSEW